jgi:phospholipid/cholesterol/gamma-HCH transport system substrate-binding protein
MKGSLYAVYFDESVQGLQVDSSIKYRGVDIGKVQRIDVAPDYRLIEVIMKIDLEGDLQNNSIASLKTAGITGIVFIELDQIHEGELKNTPHLNFISDYPVIPSRRSDISRILLDTGVIMQNVKNIDFKGIADQFKDTARSIEDFMQGKKLNSIMAHLESGSANLDAAIAKVDKTLANGKLDEAMTEMITALAETRRLIAQAKSEIDALNLKDKAERTDAILNDIEKKTKTITGDLQDTSEHLRITSENLQKLSDSLNRDPSELIFSKPAPPKKAME